MFVKRFLHKFCFTFFPTYRKLSNLENKLFGKLSKIEQQFEKLSKIEKQLDYIAKIRIPNEDILFEFENRINQNVVRVKNIIIDNDRLAQLEDLFFNVPIDYSSIDINHRNINEMKFVDTVYHTEKHKLRKTISSVLQFKDDFSSSSEERGTPSDIVYLVNYNYKKMLKRYIYVGAVFCKSKCVLDSACGVGWGTFLLAQYADEVKAFDLDNEVVSYAANEWQTENVKWVQASALDTSIFPDEQFDVITAMETIEHFTEEDGKKYIFNMQRLVKQGGYFIGTSLFPNTRREADISPVLLNNKHHLYLWTVEDIREELGKYFSTIKFIDNWMFIALKDG